MLLPESDLAQLSPEIFRACDIRGIVGETLTETVAYWLGLSFGTIALQKNQTKVVVGRDGRLSGFTLATALIQGLRETGCDVIDIGQVPTPVVYYATYALETNTGIMITGSHNPANYNGFKMMMGGDTLAQEDIQALYHCIITQQFAKGEGKLTERDMMANYIQRVTQDIQLSRSFKVVIDCGNGVVGPLAVKLFTALGCEVIPLFCDIDGTFPNHHPDPGQPENLQSLIQTVKQENADCGLAFDGDGDRLGLVTNEGDIIWPDRLMMLFVEDILHRVPGSKIIYDVKCSTLLRDRIQEFGGIAIMYKTGHSLIKRKMREESAAFSGEMSGHFFFKERWYGFDDACYAGARLLEILSKKSLPSLGILFKSLPNSINTPEINVAIDEKDKFSFIERLQNEHGFENASIITVDGVRAEFSDGWGLVRASNTTPCLVMRFEAVDSSALARIQSQFKKIIGVIAPGLNLPF